MFSSRFMLFRTFKFFFRRTLLFHFGFYAIFNINIFLGGNIEKCPFTYWLNGRWFLQIVDRDSGNIYPIYSLFSYTDLLSQMWGGGVFFLHFMLCPTFVEQNNSWNKKIIIFFLEKQFFLFNVFFGFFLG